MEQHYIKSLDQKSCPLPNRKEVNPLLRCDLIKKNGRVIQKIRALSLEELLLNRNECDSFLERLSQKEKRKEPHQRCTRIRD